MQMHAILCNGQQIFANLKTQILYVNKIFGQNLTPAL